MRVSLFFIVFGILTAFHASADNTCTTAVANYYMEYQQNMASGIGPKASILPNMPSPVAAIPPIYPAVQGPSPGLNTPAGPTFNINAQDASYIAAICQNNPESITPAQCIYGALTYIPGVTTLSQATQLCSGATANNYQTRLQCANQWFHEGNYYPLWPWDVYLTFDFLAIPYPFGGLEGPYFSYDFTYGAAVTYVGDGTYDGSGTYSSYSYDSDDFGKRKTARKLTQSPSYQYSNMLQVCNPRIQSQSNGASSARDAASMLLGGAAAAVLLGGML